MGNLANIPAQPPLRKAPTTYPLSTQSESASVRESDNAPAHLGTIAETQERIIAPTQESESAIKPPEPKQLEPERVNRGYKLREDLIKSMKRIALEEDRKLYEVMEEAMTQYLDRKKAG
jgi:hypothetical protein